MNKSVDDTIGGARTRDDLLRSFPRPDGTAVDTHCCRTILVKIRDIREALLGALSCFTGNGVPIRSFSVAETERPDCKWLAVRTADCDEWRSRFSMGRILEGGHGSHADEVLHRADEASRVTGGGGMINTVPVAQHMRVELNCDRSQMERVGKFFEENGGRIEEENQGRVIAALTAHPDVIDRALGEIYFLSHSFRARINPPIPSATCVPVAERALQRVMKSMTVSVSVSMSSRKMGGRI